METDYTDNVIVDTIGFEFYGDQEKKLSVPGIPYRGSEEAMTILNNINDNLNQMRGSYAREKERGATVIEMGAPLWLRFIEVTDSAQRKLSHQKNEVVRKVKYLDMEVIEGYEVIDGFKFR